MSGYVSQIDIVHGTLDLLIPHAFGPGPKHGGGLSRPIEQITGGTFVVKPGSLVRALHRPEERGWLRAPWGDSENNRRATHHQSTGAGRTQLLEETVRRRRFACAIRRALKAT